MTVRVYAIPRVCITALIFVLFSAAGLAAQEVVLHSTDVTTIKGNWTRVSTSGAASSVSMSSTNNNWSSTDSPQASPADYFEAKFTAEAWTPYRVWLRIRSTSDSKWNESVWVQFGDSLNSSGNSAYRIGSASGILVNLEECSGCGVSAWGWSGGSWWAGENSQVQFSTAGTKTIRIQTREDGATIDQIVLSPVKYLGTAPGAAKNDSTILARSGGAAASAATGSPRAIPGTIEAEDFDNGTNGTEYYDRSSGNSGGQYRSTDVDIETSADGGYDVGWVDSGEWLNYTVDVAAAGDYTIEFRVASPNGSTLRARFGGVDETGAVSVPATGGWQNWTTVRKTVNLAAGTQVMRLVFDNGGMNINRVKLLSGSTSSPEEGTGALGGTAWAIPGTVQAEDFDLGGSNVGYKDNTSGNSGGKYRTTDVDIESSSDTGGGYNVGWVGAGEWLTYTVNVRTAGTYTFTARTASNGTGGRFHVEFNGTNKTGTLSVPSTGGWQSFRDVSATVTLSAGVQTMRVVFDTNGTTGAIGNINYFRLAEETAVTPPPPTTSGKIRIMTWNVHFGKNSSNVLNLDGQAKIMADSRADVILLQEASTWDGDQPNSFPAKLKALTGYTWSKVWSSHSGTGSGEGTLILTKLPVVSSSIANYYNRGFSRVAVSVNGVTIDIFNGHLSWDSTSLRTSQLKSWMTWMDTFSGPEVAGGDFNAWWGESWIKTMETKYSDTWQDYTGSDQNGYTTGNIRFDYLFRAFDSNWRLTPTNCWVVSTSLSDHKPLVAEYTVK